uniref:Uncharacterized protein n=1 Tax=Sphaerodactylus townsendi TaxID=933632 RepID=A0ACB8FPI0_9SAUR
MDKTIWLLIITQYMFQPKKSRSLPCRMERGLQLVASKDPTFTMNLVVPIGTGPTEPSEVLTIGDMKTPVDNDFLKAFDIPDIETNEAIHSGLEETKTHIKPILVEMVAFHVLPHNSIPTVCIVIKNRV